MHVMYHVVNVRSCASIQCLLHKHIITHPINVLRIQNTSQVRSGKEMIRIAMPPTTAPLFNILEELHARVVRGSEGQDGCVNILTLLWKTDNWPCAEITHSEHGALIADVCSFFTLVVIIV